MPRGIQFTFRNESVLANHRTSDDLNVRKGIWCIELGTVFFFFVFFLGGGGWRTACCTLKLKGACMTDTLRQSSLGSYYF